MKKILFAGLGGVIGYAAIFALGIVFALVTYFTGTYETWLNVVSTVAFCIVDYVVTIAAVLAGGIIGFKLAD